MEKQPAGKITLVAEIGASHSNRGIEDYMHELGLTLPELQDFIRDQIVLDVGAGNARFAREVEIWNGLGLPAAQRIDSLNVAYGTADWNTLANSYANMQAGISPPIPDGHPIQLSDEVVVAAQGRVEGRLLPLDWRDLSSIPDATYDRIISVAGFPYYSDLIKTARANQSVIGTSSAETFTGLMRILKPGGICRVTVPILFDEWEKITVFRDSLKEFFRTLGCTVEAINSSGALVIEIKKLN